MQAIMQTFNDTSSVLSLLKTRKSASAKTMGLTGYGLNKGCTADLVVLTDCLDGPDKGRVSFVRVPPGGNPYWYRWRVAADWLEAHPDVDRVWCVDGTDVQMLHDPFPRMADGVFYVGSEPSTFSGRAGSWLRAHCPWIRQYLDEHPDFVVVNCGLVGGSRADVVDVVGAMAELEAVGGPFDMGAFQWLVHECRPEYVTGPVVHTVLRADDRHGAAWWRHK